MSNLPNWVVYVVFFLLAVGFLYLAFGVGKPKPPATAAQVWDVLVEQGFEPQDVTEQIKAKYPDTRLTNGIVVQSGDIDFQFYAFDNDKDPINLWGQFYAKISPARKRHPFAEHNTRVANYRIYTLLSEGKYSVAVFVGNTVVYAYCDEENEGKVAKILRKISYF